MGKMKSRIKIKDLNVDLEAQKRTNSEILEKIRGATKLVEPFG
jgi:hypothetical protein